MVSAADLFCGAGGTSTGLVEAMGILGQQVQLTAVNHWDRAVETHELNHPEARHLCESLDNINPRKLFPEGLDILWASPECFPKGTLVMTDSGQVDISQIKVGMKVLTHKGRYREVIRIQNKQDQLVELSGYGHYGLKSTASHPFYSKRITKRYPGKDPKTGKRPGVMRSLVENPYWPLAKDMGGKLWATPYRFPALPIPSDCGCELSSTFFYFVGRWLGDGSINKGDVEICCGFHEQEKFSKYWEANPLIGTEGDVKPVRQRDTKTAHLKAWGCKQLADWLVREFGYGSRGKSMPSWVFGMQRNWRKSLLKGLLDADGHWSGRRHEFTSVSKALALGVRLLASSLGYSVSLYKAHRNESKIGDRVLPAYCCYKVCWTENLKKSTDFTDSIHRFTTVKRVEETDDYQTVYNLEVAEDESYVADGIVVHNCTHHSIARGGRPINDQSRATAWCVTRWAEALQPNVILVENVPEFLNWGGLGVNGRPLKSKRGETFRAWVATLESLGYRVDWRQLCAADYGDPTTRKRLFVQAVRGRRKIVWPDPTHLPTGADLLGNQKQWTPARDIIDFSLPSTSIYERKRPLADKTLARIFAGLKKYGLKNFIVPHFGERVNQQPRTHDINDPLPAVTSHGAGSLVQPYIVAWDHQSGNGVWSGDEPLSTVTTKARHGVVEPFIVELINNSDARSIESPLSTVRTSGAHHALAEPMLLPQQSGGQCRPVSLPAPTVATAGAVGLIEPYLVSYYGNGDALSVDDPLDTVTTKERFGLAQPLIEVEGKRYRLDIKFRMLQPHELAAAQGFPSDYQFAGNKTEIVKQIGNAVPRRLARAICLAAVSQNNDITKYLGKEAA